MEEKNFNFSINLLHVHADDLMASKLWETPKYGACFLDIAAGKNK